MSPCFGALTPGQTTYEEAGLLLQQYPNVERLEPHSGVWDATLSEGRIVVGFPTDDPQTTTPIETIQVSIHSVPMGVVVDAFGEPTAVIAGQGERLVHTGSVGSQTRHWKRWLSLQFLYHDAGFIISADVGDLDDTPIVTTTLMLTTPLFFNPQSNYTRTLGYQYGIEDAVPWEGWQPFAFYCREAQNVPCRP